MLCQKCKINHANVRIIKNANGDVQEFFLCQPCAQNEGLDIHKQLNSDFFQDPFFNLLAPEPGSALSCPECKTSYYEFKKTGKFGCASCAEAFEKQLPSFIKNIQGATEHTGKFPRRFGGKPAAEKKIENLKKELTKAIMEENYERAAEIRDEIKALEGGCENE